ncbi:aminoglycoside phosphotransferase family protein [Salidesulfovibrio onnuriiensis]|uniref:aminoglycoside phosphotransferase family protein n=1 Tax=Salidesulfovibrio onnuriiensis TaxID=2583823 RepID=UPI00202B295D|nr:aminoglycoside phosphotransferase family protein [Salidesulfovibrio onnuriiensis]
MNRSKWLSVAGPAAISFLAAGEYNENYLVHSSQGQFVFRINHGSQLGLDNQIQYEFQVLEAVYGSGVTPRPLYWLLDPEQESLGDGVMLMEFLPGRPLDYDRDADEAARIFARVHSQPEDARLLVQRNPVLDIARESRVLIDRYALDHPLENRRSLLLEYHDRVLGWGEEAERLFAGEPLVIVNTEVNSHNFLIDDSGPDKRGYLVDWEKAVVSCRYQDLGHFLVPTTTLWKSDRRYSQQEKKAFLEQYLSETGLECCIEEMAYKTDILENTILLRAMAWCFMAFYEYTREDRVLKNEYTFKKITQYLNEMECFFA